MARSADQHNIDFLALCDWLEGGVLFDEENLPAADVVDILIESEIYSRQELAWEIVTSAWAELSRRQKWVGQNAPIKVSKNRLERLCGWQDVPAYGFCLALSFAGWYPGWAREFGSDYNEQGELFERLVKEAMEHLFPQWVVHQTGWTRTHPSKLAEIVKDVANQLGEAQGDIDYWANSDAHDEGLDLLCYRPFDDGRVGVPTFLMQCASGNNWERKLHTPDIELWSRIVLFAAQPKRAFAMPHALSDKEFRNKCVHVQGLLLDRYRLLSTSRIEANWVSDDLETAIRSWLKPRIEKLPRDGQ
jgi:hypothetical protein